MRASAQAVVAIGILACWAPILILIVAEMYRQKSSEEYAS